MISRRSLITGLATILAAPAIVRAGALMPVKPWSVDHGYVVLRHALATDPNSWNVVAAAEQIWMGDLITIRGGLAHRARTSDLALGLEGFSVAICNSHDPAKVSKYGYFTPRDIKRPDTTGSTSQPSCFGLRRIHP